MRVQSEEDEKRAKKRREERKEVMRENEREFREWAERRGLSVGRDGREMREEVQLFGCASTAE